MGYTPTWMIVAITVFGLAAATGIVGNHYYQAKYSAAQEKHFTNEMNLNLLRVEHDKLKTLTPALTAELNTRNGQLETIAASVAEKADAAIPALLTQQKRS